VKKLIRKAIYHQINLIPDSGLSKNDIEQRIEKIYDDIQTQNYDFTKMETIILNQNNKKRIVKRYAGEFSTESILCLCIKYIIEQAYNISFVNRNKVVHKLFGILPAVIKMMDFTIVKFDFKDFFNTISSEYVFEQEIKNTIKNRKYVDIIENFVHSTHYTYAGLNTSNIFAEIIANRFDETLREFLPINNIIFHERYIDDTVLILNKYISNDEINKILDLSLKKVFYNNVNQGSTCKVSFNNQKYCYLSNRDFSNNMNKTFDFLGYQFTLNSFTNGKIKLSFGITHEKMAKYKKRIDEIIAAYSSSSSVDFNNLELLKHRIECFCSREVYVEQKHNYEIWKVKGFISNYGELRHLLNDSSTNVDDDTIYFLKKMVEEAFDRAGFVPYFIKGSKKGPIYQVGFNLYENMKKNKTILLVENIGYDYQALVKRCEQINIDITDHNDNPRKYQSLVREYLIKTKVGF